MQSAFMGSHDRRAHRNRLPTQPQRCAGPCQHLGYLFFLNNLSAEIIDPVHVMDSAQQMDRVHQGLQSLVPRDRLFIKLHCLKELSIQEVAGILGVSENNAYSIKHRALNRLKAALQEK